MPPLSPAQAVAVFKCLGARSRLRLLQQLHRNGPSRVGSLSEKLGCPVPTVSYDLGLLYRAGLVQRERQGHEILYQVAEPLASAVLCLVQPE